ncbi:MAG: phosphoribosylamine--glycine ligase, partial [Ignavibacteriae bacterium]|nr:phosphoribosylamine--glycine ligase [Ignavibacteriota bacterium]
MKILVIGSGGREHALVWKIRASPDVSRIFCAPGNPGIGTIAECIPLKPENLSGLLDFTTTENIDLTVVGPEQPLASGIVDLFRHHGRLIVGPTKRAAQLEWSKAFAKEFMKRHGIPTAAFKIFNQSQCDDAVSYVASSPLP